MRQITATRQKESPIEVKWLASYFLLHIPLALLMSRFKSVATMHALATVLVGGLLALSGPRRTLQVAYIGAYVMGAEVLWRMTGGIVVWEFGKYVTAAIFILAIVRARFFEPPLVPIAYLLLLACSIPLTLLNSFPLETRNLISFYMSGPLALVCSAWFFSHVKLTGVQTQKLLLVVVGPIVSIAAIAFTSGLTSAELEFGTESNRVTSGGFAPNQVSAMLGLGAFAALFCLLKGGLRSGPRLVVFGVMVLLAAQSALTFSRGGLYIAGGASAVAALYMARDRRARLRILLLAGLLIISAQWVVTPLLNSYTKGAIKTRFSSTKLTGRETLAREEVELWLDNIVLGVGPGMAKYYRDPLWVGSHTEYSRLLAEHGLFGLAAMLLLGYSSWQNLARVRGSAGKAAVASTICWGLLFMMSVAMRLVAPAFMLGLSFARFTPEEGAAGREGQRQTFRLRVPSGRWHPGARAGAMEVYSSRVGSR